MNKIKLNENRFYVYRHVYKNKIFYIGSGSAGRAFEGSVRNREWKKFTEQNSAYWVILWASFKTRREAQTEELKQILKYKPSCNLKLNGFKIDGKFYSVLDKNTGKKHYCLRRLKLELGMSEHIILKMIKSNQRFQILK